MLVLPLVRSPGLVPEMKRSSFETQIVCFVRHQNALFMLRRLALVAEEEAPLAGNLKKKLRSLSAHRRGRKSRVPW